MYGTAICAGVAVIAAIVAGRLAAGSRNAGTHEPAPDHAAAANPGAGESPFTFVALFAWALTLYGWIARSVFSARPLLIDELVQMYQARIFVTGRLSLPMPLHREFFSVLHVVDVADKVYSQFPAGWPAMLAVAERLGAPWLAGPVCGAIAVVLFARLTRLLEPGASRRFVIATSILFAVAPFAAFQFGSHMNHGPTLMWLLLATVCLGEHLRARDARFAFAAGFALGAAATLRPLDAFAFALPAGVWLAARVVQYRASENGRRAFIALIASGFGIALPMAALLYVNAQTTGSPFAFGYTVLWGQSHGLGFHTAPWGDAHTPARGLELLSLYVTRLQTYLFETPFPSLLPAIVALALTPRLRALDRYLLVSSAFLGALYFAYWHDGFFLGPRFVVAWIPALVIWTARAPALVIAALEPWLAKRRSMARRELRVASAAFLGSGVLMAAAYSLPTRTAQYRGGLTSMRIDYGSAARDAGAHNALVFVRESWGAQLIARLWGLGVSRSASEAFYAKIDACVLDRTIRQLERDSERGDAAEHRLQSLMADSSRVHGSLFSPDSTEKYLPGAAYDPTCVARINEDRAGYMHYAPLLLERVNGNVYARDLHARDSLLLAEYPDRPVFLLRRQGTDVESPLEWIPARRDSLWQQWRSGQP